METRRRVAGILLHPTSLPGGHGIGDLGPEAERFVDFLAEAGARLWQIMPLGPPGYGESPYAARSAFAGNPLLISLDRLHDEGLLTEGELRDVPGADEAAVDFAAVDAFKQERLRSAYLRFRIEGTAPLFKEFSAFGKREAHWLDDFALFMALREEHGGGVWTEWEPAVLRREPSALAAARERLAGRVRYHAFVQFLFARQWRRLRAYANEREVRILGDMPIFVAHDSADVWANQHIFLLDKAGQPTVVAGVPPDYFSATGQRWGNPLYDWDALAARGFDWWIDRFRAAMDSLDLVRIDHFRGFEASWHVPASEETAVKGTWVKTPGTALFAAVHAALGEVAVVAEDLGLITPEVEELRDNLGFPGMKVLQFAFGGEATNLYLPHHHVPHSVVYTGTHDNDTTTGWYATAGHTVRDHVRRYFGVDGHDVAWDMVRHALASVADTAVVPVQDLLSLGSEARINTPGRPEGNWAWRLRPGQLTPFVAARLRGLCELYGRVELPEAERDAAEAAKEPAEAG